MAVSANIEKDLSTLLESMSGAQKKRAWRNALYRTARKVRKVAATDLKATKVKHAGKISQSIKAIVNRRLTGFKIVITGRRNNPKSYYLNSKKKRKPVALWVHTGTSNRIHYGFSWKPKGQKRYATGSTKAYLYMERARKQATPVALSELGKEFEKSAKDAVAKSIKKHYGNR